MESNTNMSKPSRSAKPLGPFRRAVLRGIGILLPPLLTIVIFLWVGSTISTYLLDPLERSVRWVIVEKLADIRNPESVPADQAGHLNVTIDGKRFRRVGSDDGDARYIPLDVYERVRENLGKNPMPRDAQSIYTRYVNQTWLQRQIVVPVFVCTFLLVVYLLGKFLAAGIGRFFWNQLERLINRVPLVRNVYSSVKQVTDFVFSDSEVIFTRVVAIEYPRRGTWTVAFVTGEGLHDIRAAAGEPLMTIFVPTCPMPFTGFALTVKQSEVIDLSMTIDQAIQFFFSCGVVIPQQEYLERRGNLELPTAAST